MRPNAARHSQRTRRTTKIHKGRRRKRNRRFHRFGQIWGRLPPAGRAMEAWKFGGLEVWLFPHDGLSRRPAGAFCSRGRFAASPLHAPFSVFRSPGRVSAPCPICPTATSFGTSQTCRGCRGNWKLGSLAFSVGLRHTTFVTSTGRLLYLLYTVWREMFTEQ